MRLAFVPQKTRVNGAVVTQDLIPTDALRARATGRPSSTRDPTVLPRGQHRRSSRV